MPAALLATPGDIHRHGSFYRGNDGNWFPKFLLVLAFSPSRDIVYRLLTSEPHGRPTIPPCHHGNPYSGYFIGVPGGPLTRPTWIDLRSADDYDEKYFTEEMAADRLAFVVKLPFPKFCDVLSCAAGSEDTTNQQSRAMRDQRAKSGCP
ncbi:MAG: hypothetical protein EXR27_04270 [Betaproteobacteria bacterium]|nr:hypothetical protein [Betaproteobacteria bacterium]